MRLDDEPLIAAFLSFAVLHKGCALVRKDVGCGEIVEVVGELVFHFGEVL
jgi:hypothetical protein